MRVRQVSLVALLALVLSTLKVCAFAPRASVRLGVHHRPMPLLHQTSKAHADLEEVAPRLGLELATTVSGEGKESDASSQDYHRATSALLMSVSMVAVVMAAAAVSLSPEAAVAVSQVELDLFDPSKFQPVCPGSDGVYQLLKYTANALVGRDNVEEYGPLIASVLLRVRLELCVLESFLYEAVIPFVRTKGVSWILPLHETVESVLAGTIFAVASNFILLGSTKILSVLFIYADALTGMPTRFLGGQAKKNLKSPGSTVGSVFKAYGDALGAVRGFLEAADTFVGRYLVIATTVYIAFKIAHYKFFNDFFP